MVACKWKTCATRRSEIIFEICLGDRIVIETTLHYLPSLKNITIYKQSHKHPVFFSFISSPGQKAVTNLLVFHPRQSCNLSPGFHVFPRTDQRSFQCPSAGKSARSPTYWPRDRNHENTHAVLGKKTHSFQQVQEVNPTQEAKKQYMYPNIDNIELDVSEDCLYLRMVTPVSDSSVYMARSLSKTKPEPAGILQQRRGLSEADSENTGWMTLGVKPLLVGG